MDRYTAVAQLREIVMTMERDLGLIALSHNEKDVLYAVQSVLAVSDGVAKSDEIRSHDICCLAAVLSHNYLSTTNI